MEESTEVDQTELLDTSTAAFITSNMCRITCDEKSSIIELDSVAVDISSVISRKMQGCSFQKW